MNRLALVSACLTFLLVGCGEDPTLTVVTEPAGENCPTGGFRVDADGEVFYSCNESQEVGTQEVAAGTDGNPCVGAALLVTVTLEDGTTRDAYVCQPIEVDETSRALILTQFFGMSVPSAVDCLCEAPEDVEACESERELAATLEPVLSRCFTEVLLVTGPIPESVASFAECALGVYTEVDACLGAIEAVECSEEVQAAQNACRTPLEEGEVACGEPTEEAMTEFQAWLQNVMIVGQFLGCGMGPV